MMKRFRVAAVVVVLIFQTSFPQEQLLINAFNRTSHSLNGQWNYIVDPYENGFYNYRYQPFEQSPSPSPNAYFTHSAPKDKSDLIEYDFDRSDTIAVPGDWNTQKEKLFYYEGTVWYKTSFDYAKKDLSRRLFLYFGAVNYQADIYLNSVKLGRHVGGFTPFNYEVTHLIKEKGNYLVVKVDNKRTKEGVPTLNTDWWNYGGITRDVRIIETAETFVRDYALHLHPNNKRRITGYISLHGSDIVRKKIRVTIPELSVDREYITDSAGRASVDLIVKSIQHWSPDTPKLFSVSIRSGNDEIKDQIGFRTITTRGTKILLNDKEIFLRGISIHEESPTRKGRANTLDDAKQLLAWAKELGCNYVRLAHYPHNEYMVRMADAMGILVWEEIPVYWTIDWENKNTYRNAEEQLTAMISRDKNRASVIVWSMANETPSGTARFNFLSGLASHARSMDSTRLISAALEQSSIPGNPNIRTIADPFAEKVDILSFNQYIGWYDGLPEKCLQIRWQIDQQKPVIISEFGADAKYGFHADTLTRFSEEYQEDLYKKTLVMIDGIPRLQGISPWILVDFRSPRRVLPGIQDGWNRKGLISDNGEKKKAFSVLQKYYREKISRSTKITSADSKK